jgi:purine-binding chemotaxis protein CheW
MNSTLTDLLLVRVGPQTLGVPALAVEQIIRMAAVTPLFHAPGTTVGVLNVHGDLLLVVDPRPRLGLETPPLHPDQRLILVGNEPRYLLWVDATDVLNSSECRPLDAASREKSPWVASIAMIDGQPLPILDLDALRPPVALGLPEASGLFGVS